MVKKSAFTALLSILFFSSAVFSQPQHTPSQQLYTSICEKSGKGTHILALSLLSIACVYSVYEQLKFLVKPFDGYQKERTKNTDKHFKEWVLQTIRSHENNPIDLTVSVAHEDPSVRTFVVPGSSEKGYLRHLMTLPHESQERVLTHLKKNHKCTATCKRILQMITATIDHEYAHAKYNHIPKRIIALVAALVVFNKIFPRIHTWLKSRSNLLYATAPVVAYLATVSLLKKYTRMQEQQADENIRNDHAILTGGKKLFQQINEQINDMLEAIKKSNPNLRFILGMEHKNGNFLSFLAGHPPLNQRIARLEERIDKLN